MKTSKEDDMIIKAYEALKKAPDLVNLTWNQSHNDSDFIHFEKRIKLILKEIKVARNKLRKSYFNALKGIK